MHGSNGNKQALLPREETGECTLKPGRGYLSLLQHRLFLPLGAVKSNLSAQLCRGIRSMSNGNCDSSVSAHVASSIPEKATAQK
jgi:hypothetical protein